MSKTPKENLDLVPIAVSVKDAKRISNLGHQAIYDLLADGIIESRKYGNRTLVILASLRAFIESLPSPSFRQRLSQDERKANRSLSKVARRKARIEQLTRARARIDRQPEPAG